jgi:indole-3-glycerol phosphate synthase
MEGSGIIAEFKRRSPSRGIINSRVDPGEVCSAYLNSGASAVSVLTNSRFFGGNDQDLLTVRQKCNGVILRKEFIIDDYQVIESKSIGADAILLIADILSEKELQRLSALALSLELEILYEIHDEKGTDKLPDGARLIGVNSRNLDNFIIDMDIPRKIISKLPGDRHKNC